MNYPAKIAAPRVDEKPRLWAMLLTDHRATFNEVIRLAAKHRSDGMLQDMRLKAERLSAALEREALDPHFTSTHGSIGKWGPNGRGPEIRVLLQSAQFRDQVLCERAAGLGRAA